MRSADLTGLDAFAAVARRRSFRAAATARGVSPSTLSLAVRELEARMGVRLLNRTTRSVALTEAGETLLARLAPALDDMAAAMEAAVEAAAVPTGSLRINAPQPAIDLVLAPLLARFLQTHPQVRAELAPESALIDIVAAGFHAGVRWGESLAQDMIAVPLSGPQRYVVVAAPALLESFGEPKEPHDLLNAPCIRHRFPSGLTPPWEFERDGRVLRLDPPARLLTLSQTAQREAALAGAASAPSLRAMRPPTSPPAAFARSCRTGCRPSRDPSSTIPAAVTRPRPSAPSSTSSAPPNADSLAALASPAIM